MQLWSWLTLALFGVTIAYQLIAAEWIGPDSGSSDDEHRARVLWARVVWPWSSAAALTALTLVGQLALADLRATPLLVRYAIWALVLSTSVFHALGIPECSAVSSFGSCVACGAGWLAVALQTIGSCAVLVESMGLAPAGGAAARLMDSVLVLGRLHASVVALFLVYEADAWPSSAVPCFLPLFVAESVSWGVYTLVVYAMEVNSFQTLAKRQAFDLAKARAVPSSSRAATPVHAWAVSWRAVASDIALWLWALLPAIHLAIALGSRVAGDVANSASVSDALWRIACYASHAPPRTFTFAAGLALPSTVVTSAAAASAAGAASTATAATTTTVAGYGPWRALLTAIAVIIGVSVIRPAARTRHDAEDRDRVAAQLMRRKALQALADAQTEPTASAAAQ